MARNPSLMSQQEEEQKVPTSDIPPPLQQPSIILPQTFTISSLRNIPEDQIESRLLDTTKRAFTLMSTGFNDRDELVACLETTILPAFERAVAMAQQYKQLMSGHPHNVTLPSKTAVRSARKSNKYARKRFKSDVEKEGKLTPKK